MVYLASRNHGAEFADISVHLVSSPFLDLAVVLTEKMATVCTSLLSAVVRVLMMDLNEDEMLFVFERV